MDDEEEEEDFGVALEHKDNDVLCVRVLFWEVKKKKKKKKLK